ncbi:hypothetical protein Tco_1283281 [Tanacetum coccineum]
MLMTKWLQMKCNETGMVLRKSCGPMTYEYVPIGCEQEETRVFPQMKPEETFVEVETVLIGGRGRPKPLAPDECPWAVQITKFLSKGIVDQVEKNPDIPIRALQEELQRKYELGVSRQKAFRAKAAALNQVKGDYRQQYTMLRDYCLELRRANHDTTIKIEVERDSVSSDENTRMFKRIYICLGPLKKGFKACGRDLLGLDGAFMKEPYPGQLLTAIGLDANNGIYPLAMQFDRQKDRANQHRLEQFVVNVSMVKILDAKYATINHSFRIHYGIPNEKDGANELQQVLLSMGVKSMRHSLSITDAIAANYNKSLYYTIGCLNGRVMWKKSQIPTTLTPPKHNTPVGRPRKNRRKSKEEKAEMVKDGKLSRAYKTVTCMKCGNLGHNSRSCKGQKIPTQYNLNYIYPSTAPAKKPSDAGTRKRPSDAPAPSTAPAKMNQATKKQCAMSN